LSTGSGHDATSAEVDDLKARLSAVAEQLQEARHRFLTSQDKLIGSEAEIGRLRERLQVEIEERTKLHREIESLQDQISEMRLSASWRIGNRIVRQVPRLTPFGSKR
jgi:chromosome segregation ATPase